MKDISAISNLRLRASYGLQGNIDRNTSPFFIGEYSDSTILPGGKENIINVMKSSKRQTSLGKTTNVNFGLDLGVFNNRINLTADVYNRKGTDMISMKETPLETGFGIYNDELGKLNQQGDLNWQYQPKISIKIISNGLQRSTLHTIRVMY
ncbi:hypothetical protein [Chryseobacterium indoltheticum]|uniref:hypothetical protein n=1 Tax=Chryseobacterium indoltheticum TaxID=254 RepID=UPI003F4963D2